MTQPKPNPHLKEAWGNVFNQLYAGWIRSGSLPHYESTKPLSKRAKRRLRGKNRSL